MDGLATETIITALFLGALIAAGLLIRRYSGQLTGRIAVARPITCTAVTALGTDARAYLVEVETRRMLIVAGRRGGLEIVHLETEADPA